MAIILSILATSLALCFVTAFICIYVEKSVITLVRKKQAVAVIGGDSYDDYYSYEERPGESHKKRYSPFFKIIIALLLAGMIYGYIRLNCFIKPPGAAAQNVQHTIQQP